MSPLVFTLALFAVSPQTAALPSNVEAFPRAFHGEWTAYPEYCGTGDSDDQLFITADKAQFYEGAGEVISGFWLDEGRLQMTLKMEEHEEVWETTGVWHLSPDGKTLRFELPTGGTYDRKRCP